MTLTHKGRDLIQITQFLCVLRSVFPQQIFGGIGNIAYICRNIRFMQNRNIAVSSVDTYIWDEGYPRPTEQERICIFVCSCIESVSEILGCKASDVYRRMEKVGLIHDYIIACYDTLHTESRENVTKDIIETLVFWEKKKGVVR